MCQAQAQISLSSFKVEVEFEQLCGTAQCPGHLISCFIPTYAGNESPPELDFHEFGLWDAIFNAGY